MKKWLALLMSCLALGLVAAGCGGDDEDEGNGGGAVTQAPATEEPATEEPAETEAKPAARGKTVKVSMKDIKFVPHDVTVAAGSKLVWTNNDQVAHTVTKEKGPGESFDSGTVDAGGTFEQKVTEPGKIDYVCTIHPGQTGTITVE